MNASSSEAAADKWYSVRCVFRDVTTDTYEERITIWLAHDHEDAIAMAEKEAAEYAEALDGVSYVKLAQSFSLDEMPRHGSEVFSLIRDSDLDENDYLSKFFATGSERQDNL